MRGVLRGKRRVRLALMGTFGEANTGDDVLLLSLIEGVRERIPDVLFIVFSGDPDHTRNLLEREGFPRHNFELVYSGRWGLREPGESFPSSLAWIARTVKRIRDADLLLIGPGTQFQDVTRKYRLLFFLARAILSWLLRTPHAFIGMGYWHIDGRLCRVALRFAANRSVFLSTRDLGSARDLSDLGIPTSVLYPLADISFVRVPPPGGGESPAENPGCGGGAPVVGLSLRHFPKEGFDEAVLEKYFNGLAGLVSRIVRETGAQIRFYPFYSRSEFSDMTALEMFCRRLPDGGSAIEVRQWGDLSALRRDIAGCDALIGMRLHAVLLAVQAAVPVLAFSYSEKAWRFMSENGLGDYAVRIEKDDSERLDALWDGLWSGRHRLRGELTAVRERQRLLALRHIDLVLDALPKF